VETKQDGFLAVSASKSEKSLHASVEHFELEGSDAAPHKSRVRVNLSIKPYRLLDVAMVPAAVRPCE